MGSKSGGQKFQESTGSQTSAPAPAASQAITSQLQRVQDVQNLPYTPYTGQLVAGFTPQQQQAFGQVGNLQGVAQPYIDQAKGMTTAAANSVSPQNWGQTVGSYMNPFAQDVIAPTLANLRETFGQQRNALTGASILGGGAGGSRSGIAQAELGREQGLAQGQTIGDLLNQMYGQAAGQANTSAQLGMAGAGQIAGLGNQALQTGLTGTNALLQSGNLQQAQGQAGLSTAYQQWLQAQGFPYAQTGWGSSQIAGLSPELGGTTAGTQYTGQPQPSSMATNLGLGAAGLGFASQNPFGNLGSGISNIFGGGGSNLGTLYAKGGRIGRDLGGDLPEEKGGEGGGSIVPDPPIIAPKTNFPQLDLSTHGGGGSGGGSSSGSDASGIMGDITAGLKLAATIAPMFMVKKGGRVNYADGGMSPMPAGLGDALVGLPINLMGAGKGLGMTPPSEPFGSTGLPFSAGVGIGYIGQPPKISGSANFPKLKLSGPSETPKTQQPGLSSDFKEGQTAGTDIKKLIGSARGGRQGLLTGGTPDDGSDDSSLDDYINQKATAAGYNPQHLKAVMDFESGSDPTRWGGKGGNYYGLIQFGPEERQTYGVVPGKTDAYEQVDAALNYLQDRGLKPGMGLADMYSTVNAGSPGHYERSDDGRTTVGQKAQVIAQRNGIPASEIGGTEGGGFGGQSADNLQQLIQQQLNPQHLHLPDPNAVQPGAFLSPAAAQALMTFGFGMAASPARTVGQAAGQGGLEAVKQYQSTINQQRQNQALATQQENIASEIAQRRGQLGLEIWKQQRLRELAQDYARAKAKADLGTTTKPDLMTPQLLPKSGAAASSPSSATAPVAGTPSTATGAPSIAAATPTETWIPPKHPMTQDEKLFEEAKAQQDVALGSGMAPEAAAQQQKVVQELQSQYRGINLPEQQTDTKVGSESRATQTMARAHLKELFPNGLNGPPATNTGPMAKTLTEVAGAIEQLKMASPESLKPFYDWAKAVAAPGTDPKVAQSLESTAIGMVFPLARESAPPGTNIKQGEFKAFQGASPGIGLMPDAIKYLVNNIIIPRTQYDIDKSNAMRKLDPSSPYTNIPRDRGDWENDHPLQGYFERADVSKSSPIKPTGNRLEDIKSEMRRRGLKIPGE